MVGSGSVSYSGGRRDAIERCCTALSMEILPNCLTTKARGGPSLGKK